MALIWLSLKQSNLPEPILADRRSLETYSKFSIDTNQLTILTQETTLICLTIKELKSNYCTTTLIITTLVFEEQKY